MLQVTLHLKEYSILIVGCGIDATDDERVDTCPGDIDNDIAV